MNKGKILVIDDKIDFCIALERILCMRGYDARGAYNGTEAIVLLENEEFDFVLSDYVMPKVSGYDVAMFLDTLEKKPKFGLMTGCDEKLMTLDDEDLKVDFILKKPFDFSELERHIDDALNVG